MRAGTWTHARSRSHVHENKLTAFKTLLLRHAETSDQTRKHAENSAGSYLLLQRARGARRVWAGEDKDISNARLRPAKQTKLTYSLIAFNKDNTSPEYRWDPERRNRLRAPPQTGWHTNKAGELIFNSKLWIPNRLSQRLPLPQQTFFLICSINGNSVPIKTSHPDEFNLSWSRLERVAAQRSVTTRMNKAHINQAIPDLSLLPFYHHFPKNVPDTSSWQRR